jgi:peroxiredoxin
MPLAHEKITCLAAIAVACELSAGCGHSCPARVGIIPNEDVQDEYLGVNVGDCAPEFSFLDEEGEVARLSDLRGQVILLLFPDDLNWPDCQRCRLLEQLASYLSCAYATVTVVTVATPDKSCEESLSAMRACEVKGRAQLFALCDQCGRVRRLYGPGAAGQCVLIDSDGTVRTRIRLDDLQEIERMARVVVSDHVLDYYRIGSPAREEANVGTGSAVSTRRSDRRTFATVQNATEN